MAKSKATFSKKEKEKKRQQQKQEKRAKMEERKANQVKGKSLNDMMAYVDEDGNITSTPPLDIRKKRVYIAEEIEIGVPKASEEPADAFHEGKIDYFNRSKGFGFIIDNKGNKIFFHINHLAEAVNENDKVTFEMERGPKGWNAVGVKKKIL